ncbi:ribonuclease T2-like protein [Podospora aff. communis PSN243]|uniref:ribonuclease T2 n=1 Tax=Podospora aff. communis PSN243 TaxID=3040156 RepID=A0AAV9G9K3_9PEZI|nr:ribonuclease T2-like protein [Podospora aff. communis PSN243]
MSLDSKTPKMSLKLLILTLVSPVFATNLRRPHCPNSILSCSSASQSPLLNTCCTETLGGLVLSTQFWSTYTGLESAGQLLPANSWTLHSLWPDFCNGSYTQYCDLNRQYDPRPSPNTTTGKPDGIPVPPYSGPTVDTFLSALSKPGKTLLKWMNEFWIAQGQPNTELWAHEFSKHATCFGTFAQGCFSERELKLHDDMLDYFDVSARFFARLPTYDWLAEKGITPRNSTGYSLREIQAALEEKHGGPPFVGCAGPRWNETEAGKGSGDAGRTVLSEVWYYYHVYGRVQEGRGKEVGADVNGGSVSSCAKAEGAVWYYERTKGSEGRSQGPT